LWLQLEELAKQDSVGLDTHKSFAEVNEDGDVEDWWIDKATREGGGNEWEPIKILLQRENMA
jgi:hypothetical protein